MFRAGSRVTRNRRGFCWVGVLLVVAGLGRLPVLTAEATEAKPVAVATEAPRASDEAIKILEAGGNAADAAVVAALVSGVVNPSSSGLGGGAFIHYWDAAKQQPTILDARERAPAEIDGEAFEQRPFPFEQRGKWVGVPGELAGLVELHRQFGSKSWASLVRPAITAAERGYEVSLHLARALGFSEQELRVDPKLAAQWFGRGRPVSGARLANPLLALTLRRIAREGAKGFYEGVVAANLVKTVREAGGWLSAEDLKRYQVKERQPLRASFGEVEIITMPPPSAGGLMLAQAAKLFTPKELQALGFNTPAYQHALAEAFRASMSDRFRYLGDPDYEPVDVSKLLTDERMHERRRAISLERTHRIGRFGQEEHGTHHMVLADAYGNVVSLTTTVNRAFGAKLLAKDSGVLLNDELGDFSNNSWMEPFGGGASPNRARGGARPISSMTPTFVLKDGKVVLAIGGSGGMNIATDVAQMLFGRLVFGLSTDELLRAPRFQVPVMGDTISVLGEGTTVEHMNELKRRGEIVGTIDFAMTAVQMITIEPDGSVHAAADPRKFGKALVSH
jgi:gamma-glutamyltranspeptidase / glutathione hydrolase